MITWLDKRIRLSTLSGNTNITELQPQRQFSLSIHRPHTLKKHYKRHCVGEWDTPAAGEIEATINIPNLT